MTKPKICPVCGHDMLHYENPDRWLCPRVARHLLYVPRSQRGQDEGR